MLRLSVREFNKNISKALKNTPVEITNRGYVVARIIPPGWFWKEIAEKAGAKYKAEAIETLTKINMEKSNGVPPIPMPAPAKASKNAGERSSDTPSRSVTPPPQKKSKSVFSYYSGENAIPTLRKKLCPKHSIFSCGCPEKVNK